ncbi:hypothetical protein NHX12_012128, partial [Muraenolepis orangiensis]
KYKEFERAVRVEEMDGLQLVKRLAEDMEDMFHKKAQAMEQPKISLRVRFQVPGKGGDYEYFNAVLINEMDKENHNSAIVNGVFWSEALNKVFVDNFEKDPSLIWQYFGSAKGFFRQYPGIKWQPDEHGVIAFDCRNREWYIQAATSPKDLVILVDLSGSMKGLRLTIARQTVSSILDTLGGDDFFNIIAYNEELHYVEPCLNGTLVQADVPNKDVRIFPYLIGRESAFAENLKWMACANKGYFTQISTLADVQENVMEYLHVLSRPKVIDQEHDTVWTEAYVDNTVSLSLCRSLYLSLYRETKLIN